MTRKLPHLAARKMRACLPTRDARHASGQLGTLGKSAQEILPRPLLVALALVAPLLFTLGLGTRAAGAERPRAPLGTDQPAPFPRDTGYRGAWYANQPSGDEYRYKYSGGFATYPHQTVPCALYDAAVDRTFFCYNGAVADGKSLLHLVGEFDHATGRVSRPVILLDKQTTDAHDNPTLMLDDAGHVWVFSAAHGRARPAYIHRSTAPHSIDRFERIAETSFSYAHPWWIPGRGFLFAQTHYLKGRQLAIQTSPDGRDWSKPRPFALMEQGSYQVTWRRGTRLATVFDMHPEPIGLNARANIYFAQTDDFGQSWQTSTGETLALPLTNPQNPALVYDSRADQKLVYLKDLNFDAEGWPIILYLVSNGYHSGPRHGLRTWYTLRWTGRDWDRREFTTSDHNYDHGSLFVDEQGRWQVVAPTDPGPQPWTTGGEMVLWQSDNQGATWRRVRSLTSGSSRNHTYARRPVDAHPQFYALWADGNPLEPSQSSLYFTTRDGAAVYCLPREMTGDSALPERLSVP
jgi:hypothetical protein